MTDLRQAAQQALERLEACVCPPSVHHDIINPLRTALEQQQAEPVADALGHVGFQEWWDAVADDYEVIDFKKMRRAWNAAVKYEAPPQQQAEPECWCHKCNENRLVNNIPFSMTRMILCPTCRNKRCPKASDHRLDCTGSNETGQPGSVYPAPPQQQAEPLTCAWSPENNDFLPGTYSSACGELWSFIDGGWKDNRVRYCHGCGGKVVEASSGIQELKP